MRRRRFVRAAVTVLVFGVVGSARAQCTEASLRDVGVSYSFGAPSPYQLDVEGRLDAGDCAGPFTVEVAAAGRTLVTRNVTEGTFDLNERIEELPRDTDDATMRVRGPDGAVLARTTTPIDDYREDPASFEIVCHGVDARQRALGAEVTVTLQVRNYGYAPGYVARLVAGGETVTETIGELSAFLDDNIESCEGGEVTLTQSFDEPGRFDLRAVVEPSAEAGTGDAVDLGPVWTGGLGPALGGGAVGALGLGVAYRRWRGG